jgi:dihydropteroate synthase
MNQPVIWNIQGKLFQFSEPLVMGVINITPDSFYAGSRQFHDKALNVALRMHNEGASIIDIGGASSRPGSAAPSLQEELDRVLPVIESISKAVPEALISVDTYRSIVADSALSAGAHIINDISAGHLDPDMLDVVARYDCPYIAMHMKGDPTSMQSLAHYEDVVLEVVDYFFELKEQLRQKGIFQWVIDPGFGFAKLIEHNYQLLYRLRELSLLEAPILAGISRKSMIYKLLDQSPEDALPGSTALHWELCHQGVSILRTHDVKSAYDVIALYQKTRQYRPKYGLI